MPFTPLKYLREDIWDKIIIRRAYQGYKLMHLTYTTGWQYLAEYCTVWHRVEIKIHRHGNSREQ